jgi:cold shock CspA family protein/ribosome-associated translation inhibitor RaiA
MAIPLKVTSRHELASPALEARIRKLAERLERFSQHILHCEVIVATSSHRHRQGNLFDIRIEMTAPATHISVQRAGPHDPSHQDPYVALRDAFAAARRQLQDYERERRGAVKQHHGLPHGWISDVDTQGGFGRIETDDGRRVFFHRNSVLGKSFELLTPGGEVTFVEEPGVHGPQASTVHVL